MRRADVRTRGFTLFKLRVVDFPGMDLRLIQKGQAVPSDGLVINVEVHQRVTNGSGTAPHFVRGGYGTGPATAASASITTGSATASTAGTTPARQNGPLTPFPPRSLPPALRPRFRPDAPEKNSRPAGSGLASPAVARTQW